ncbi:universal stress protein [Dactylosporangium sp. NPDC049140]|uniref:universal stress protein n=1 Tax=Dactylosporangium sp. NPDC049140 TaxID=3155647 RepID=UPI0033E99741
MCSAASPAERWTGPESLLPQHQPIVVGADGSTPSELAVELAFAEAASRGVTLTAVRAWQEPAHRWGRSVDPARLATAAQQVLAAQVEPWRAKYPTVQVLLRAVQGTVAPVLVSEAHDALMVVLGPRGQGGFEGLRLGSVTQQVLQHSSVPVLVARQP